MTGINTREHVILLTMKLRFANQTITKRLVLLIRKNLSKLWSTINEVCSRKPKSTNVKNLEIDNQKLTNSAAMAEAFNKHFSTIGCKLTDVIGSANSAETFLEYLPTANSVFSICKSVRTDA